MNVATTPGDTVFVRDGTYVETVNFPASGAPGLPITLENYPGERPFISADGGVRQQLVLMTNRSDVVLSGFELGNMVATSAYTSGAVIVMGSGNDISILDNYVHDLSVPDLAYANGRCIQVRGLSPTVPSRTSPSTATKSPVCRDRRQRRRGQR